MNTRNRLVTSSVFSVLFGLGITSSNTALARRRRQDPPPVETPPPATNTTPAVTETPAVVVASPPPVETTVRPETQPAEPVQTPPPPAPVPPIDPKREAESRRLFEQGRLLFEADNFNGALGEFERAYEMLDGHPNRYILLFNIAQSHERLFHYEVAIDYYNRYLTEGGERVRDREKINDTLRALEALLGTVTVDTNIVFAEVWIDNRRVGSAPGTLRIAGGDHTLQLRADGYLPAQTRISVTSREDQSVRLRMERVNVRRGLSPVFFWTGVGITAAGAVTATALGLYTLRLQSDFNAMPDGLRDPASRVQGRAFATGTDIALASTGALALATLIIGLNTQWTSERNTTTRAMIVPSVDPVLRTLGVAGTF